MQRLLEACVCFSVVSARVYIQAQNVDCGGTPILAWDSDSSDSKTGSPQSVASCQSICDAHLECSGFTYSQGACWWARAPLTPFPAPGKNCSTIASGFLSTASPKCTRPEETMRLGLMFTDTHPTPSSRMMHYEFGGTSGCLYRSYDLPAVRECTRDKWIILLGGSNHHQYAEAMYQFFNPCQRTNGVFPCDLTKWYWNNTMENAGAWRVWSDLVMDPSGNVISFRTETSEANDLLRSADALTTAGPWLNNASVDKFLNYSLGLVIPPGSVRVTWVRTRWFPFAYSVVEMLRRRAWPTGPVPIIHGSIGRWYGFTPQTSPSMVAGDMAGMVNDFKTKMLDIQEVYIEDDPNTEGVITPTLASVGLPGIELRARDLPGNVDRLWSAYLTDNHRTNALHTILMQRFWNIICDADDLQPVYYSRMLLPVQPCEPNAGNWIRQTADNCGHVPLMFTAQSGAITAIVPLPQRLKQMGSEDQGLFSEEDNLPVLQNPGNSFNVIVTVICTIVLLCLYVLWLFPTFAFLLKFYCCPRFCGCHKRELKVLARPEEVQEEGFEEVDLTKKPPPRSQSPWGIRRESRAGTVMAKLDAKPDYLGPNVKKRFMGGLEGYDFVGDDCQFQQSGLQKHGRKTISPAALNKLARPPPPRSQKTGPPPPPPAPPGPASPGERGLVELQQHEGAHQQEYQATPQPSISDPVKPKPAAGGGGQKRHLDAFGFARYAASVHVVCGHLYRKSPQPVEDWYTSDWGFTWVPWFMMLSGFILTYARLGSSKPDKLDPVWTFFIQRTRSVYPLYLSSLFCGAALDAYIKSASFTLGNWHESIMSLLLLQAWDPTVTEHTYQSHCWFLSCILPYWMVHNHLYKFIKKLDNKFLWGIAAFVSLWPWVFLIIIPGALGNINWFSAHKWGKTDTSIDLLVVMLKFHPIFYFPVYLFGMVIAVLFVRQGDSLNWVVRHGAALGYFGLFLVFVVTPWLGTKPYEGIPASKLTCRLGVLAPLQGLSLVGLAAGTDPVARLFSWLPLQIGERISFPQYVFQFIVFTIWSQYTGLGYWVLLIAFSLAGAVLIQEPLARPTKDRVRKLKAFIWMILFPVICVLLLMISGNEMYFPPPGRLPDHVSYNAEAYDTKLTLSTKPYQLLDGIYKEGEFVYTNPSFVTTSREELRNFTYGNVTNESYVTVQDLWVTARRFRLDIMTDPTSVVATENGQPIFRAPVCTFGDPLQGCSGLVDVPEALDEADCEAICCGRANCGLFQWINAVGGNPSRCGMQDSNVAPNCTLGVVEGLGKTGIKTAPVLPYNASANLNQTAFWHTINASATITSTWHSDIVFGTLEQETMTATCPLEVVPPQSGVADSNGVWYPCTPYAIYAEANGTMFQLIATGPEDARLFLAPNGDLYVSFNSNLPQAMPQAMPQAVNTTNSSLPPLPATCGGASTQFFTSSFPPSLRANWSSYANGQCPLLNATEFYNGTGPAPPPTPLYSAQMPVPVQYTLNPDLRIAQKNWIHLPGTPTRFITNLNPVEIMQVQGGNMQLLSSYRNVRIAVTAAQHGLVFHGGANAILVKSRPIPDWAVTWDVNETDAPTPVTNTSVPNPCLTPFTSGTYAQSHSPTPTVCTRTGNTLSCTGGQTSDGNIDSATQITFATWFNETNLVGYWMTDQFGNCGINFGFQRQWSYLPVPPEPTPPVPPVPLTPKQRAALQYYYLTRPEFYLIGFHSVDNFGRYRNYLAELETTKPFKMIRISDALPLLEYPVPQPGFNHGVRQKMAFLSTIAELENGNIALGYGTSNYQARTLVLSRAQYEGMYSEPIPKPAVP